MDLECDKYLQTMISNQLLIHILRQFFFRQSNSLLSLTYHITFLQVRRQLGVSFIQNKLNFICILNHQCCSLKQALIYNSMKKYTYFESSAALSQLQARLDKNSYLSKTSLPNSSDAKVFLLFQRLKKIPKRTTHPNLYHWYILMKQFSIRTIEIWQTQALGKEEDRFINDYVNMEMTGSEKENSSTANNKELALNGSRCKIINTISTPKNSQKCLKIEDWSQNAGNKQHLAASSLKYIPYQASSAGNMFRSDFGSPAYQIQYVMEMQLKQNKRRVHGLRQRLQQQRYLFDKIRLQLMSLEQQQGSIRVVFRAQAEQCERLKDKISQWQQISNLRFRKQKRFNIKSENKSERIIAVNDLGIATTN